MTTISQLLQRCIDYDVVPSQFTLLFNQLSPSDGELTQILHLKSPSNYDEVSYNEAKLKLLLSLFTSDDSKLTTLFETLPSLDTASQSMILKRLLILLKAEGHLNNIGNSDGVKDNLVGTGSSLAPSISTLKRLFSQLLDKSMLSDGKDFLGTQSSSLQVDSVSPSLNFTFNDIDSTTITTLLIDHFRSYIIASMNCLDTLLWQSIVENLSFFKFDPTLVNQTSERLKTLGLHNLNNIWLASSSSTLKPSNLVITLKKLKSQTPEIKEYFWFIHLFKHWNYSNTISTFLNLYQSNFHINQANIAEHLIRINFLGISLSILNNEPLYIIYNWKNFIVACLPNILSALKVENFEDSLKKVFNGFDVQTTTILSTFSIGSSKKYDLRQSFVKSCILQKLITIHTYHKVLPLNQQSLVNELSQANHDSNLNKNFTEKLLNINPEFVSLEESELINYVNSLAAPLEFLLSKQQEFTELILKIIQDLILDKNNEKMFRLLTSILNNPTILKIIIFNSSPVKLLGFLVDYVDSTPFNCDDDENFQDNYSYFGVILLAIIAIVDTFHVDIHKIQSKKSFVIDYINNFYYSLGDKLTNEIPDSSTDEDKTITENYNNLLSDWINALFDDSNDGLSDDLIKSITVKQIYKIVPIVYQQAIIACNSNRINLSILSGGIDYLSQMFLIPCTLSIINWLLGEITNQNEDPESLPVKALYEIIKSNLGENFDASEPGSETDIGKLLFKIVLRMASGRILRSLRLVKNWENSEHIRKIISVISNVAETSDISMNGTDFDTNIDEKIREMFTRDITEKDESTANKIVIQYIHSNKLEFLKLIVNELQKQNNDDSKKMVNIAAYYIVVSSVSSNEVKANWLDILRSLPDIKKTEPLPDQFIEFTLTMDSHYSSIFDDNTNTNSNHKSYTDVDSEMFGDFIEEDDDDLFDEKRSKPTSAALVTLLCESRKHESLLSSLQSLRSRYYHGHSLYKSLAVLTDIVIDELSNLSW